MLYNINVIKRKCNFFGCNVLLQTNDKRVNRCDIHRGIKKSDIDFRTTQKKFIEKYFGHYINKLEIITNSFSYGNSLDVKLTILGLEDYEIFLSSLAACHKKDGRSNKRSPTGPNKMLENLKKRIGFNFGSSEYSDAIGTYNFIKKNYPNNQSLLSQIDHIISLMSQDVIFAPDEINRIEKDKDTKEDIIKKLKLRNGGYITEYHSKWLDLMESLNFFV